ncbi:MAG: hypothetical protein AB2989_02435 [Candidatus Symbiodolus clandestinus]
MSIIEELVNLFLEGHGVNTLPENVFPYLTHLTNFKVNNIKLTELPEDFSKLTSLWQLCFKNSDIPKIPSGIALLIALQELAFSNCQLIELTKEDVGLLHNVRNLTLDNNRLTALPDLSSLDNIRILNVSDNRFHEFPSKDFLFPRKLFKINLSGNNLETIPDDIGVLLDYPENQTPILIELFMDRNPIKSLSPKLIKNLPKLLYVNFNTDYIDDRIIEEMLVKYKGPQPAHKTGYFFLPY